MFVLVSVIAIPEFDAPHKTISRGFCALHFRRRQLIFHRRTEHGQPTNGRCYRRCVRWPSSSSRIDHQQSPIGAGVCCSVASSAADICPRASSPVTRHHCSPYQQHEHVVRFWRRVPGDTDYAAPIQVFRRGCDCSWVSISVFDWLLFCFCLVPDLGRDMEEHAVFTL